MMLAAPLTIPAVIALGYWLPHRHSVSAPQEWRLLVGALLVCSMLALTSASQSAVTSGRYATASLLFGVTGSFPRRPARFLEWARNTGILRVTGIAYQFRHDTYQQWLTEGGGSRDVTVRSDPAADARSG